MANEKLTKDDLVLLMESYRNMITMHQTILDQSNKTIDKLDSIITKQDSFIHKQASICNSLVTITEKLKTIDNSEGSINERINTHEKKSIEDHHVIKNKIHVGWIGMVTIIITLIGLIITIITYLHEHVPQ